MRAAVMVGVLAAAGCAKNGKGVGDAGGEAPPQVDVAPVAALEPDPGSGLEVFALHESGEGCVWKAWRAEGDARVLGHSPTCPTQILWNPDGSEVVYTTEAGTFVAPWLRDGEAARIEPPAWPDDWLAPWISAGNGRLRMVATVSATAVERDGQLWFEAGELSIPVVQEETGWVTYGLKGVEVVPPDAGDRNVGLPPWGLDMIAVFVERGADGAWTRLAALPTRWEASDTPGPDVGEPLQRAAVWPSLSAMFAACGDGLDCSAGDLADNAELQERVGAEDADGVGFLAGDPGGVLFAVEWGDTPHAARPVFSCADAGCSAPVQLEGLDDEHLLSVQPRGRYVLVADEHEGARPRLYVQGSPAPVLTLPDAVRSGWMPARGLPAPRP